MRRPSVKKKQLLDYCDKLETEGCNLCPLGQANKLVVSRGNISSPIIFAGSKPTTIDIKEGYPFSDRNGEILEEIINKAKEEVFKLIKPPSEYYFTYSGLCLTPDNRPLKIAEQKACSIHFKKQLRMIMPVTVVALGKGPLIVLKEELAKRSSYELFNSEPVEINITSDWSFKLWYMYSPDYMWKQNIRENNKLYKQVLNRMTAILRDSLIRELDTNPDVPF